MYVSIDRDNMRFLARHENHTALSHLANIEAAHVSVVLLPCDEPRDFTMLSDLELHLLYKHTADAEPGTASRPLLQAHCVALAMQLPERKLNTFEVEVQSHCIPDDDKTGRYRYVPGATRPQREADLFEPERLTCAPAPAERVAELAAQALQRGGPVAGTSAPAAPRSPAARPAAGAAATPAAPRGGGRQAIWAHMDALWEKAGKPTDVKLVLTLRKTCMDELEPQGYKRTSASSELGNWMKARCPQ